MTVDSLIDINIIISLLNNFILRKVSVKPYGWDKIYIDKDLIEYKLYQSIDQSVIRIFILRYSTIYIHFMMEMGELVRYYILPISISGYKFGKTSSIVN